MFSQGLDNGHLCAPSERAAADFAQVQRLGLGEPQRLEEALRAGQLRHLSERGAVLNRQPTKSKRAAQAKCSGNVCVRHAKLVGLHSPRSLRMSSAIRSTTFSTKVIRAPSDSVTTNSPAKQAAPITSSRKTVSLVTIGTIRAPLLASKEAK